MITHICDHRIEIWRATPQRNQWGDVIEVWVRWPVPNGWNARPDQAWSGLLQNPGAGEEQGARRRWFLDPDCGAEERDVMRVVEGPEAGRSLLRIVSVTRPTDPFTVHHQEVNVEPTTVELPEESDS